MAVGARFCHRYRILAWAVGRVWSFMAAWASQIVAMMIWAVNRPKYSFFRLAGMLQMDSRSGFWRVSGGCWAGGWPSSGSGGPGGWVIGLFQ